MTGGRFTGFVTNEGHLVDVLEGCSLVEISPEQHADGTKRRRFVVVPAQPDPSGASTVSWHDPARADHDHDDPAKCRCRAQPAATAAGSPE